MFDGTYPVLMAEYNRWMNERLYAACAGLADDERRRDRGAFFKSIHGTLDHILWGDRLWLSRFNGKAYATGAVGDLLYPDFGELKAARADMDQQILEWACAVTPEALAEVVTWTSRTYGFTQTVPRWVLVTQMFNHQTHHRGQLTTLMSQAGVDPGPTDIQALPLLHG